MKKRLLSFFLTLCLLLGCVVTASAAEAEEQGSVTSEEASQTADQAVWEAQLGEFSISPANAYTPTSAENLLGAEDTGHAYTHEAMKEEEPDTAPYVEGEVLYARSSGGFAAYSRSGDTTDAQLAELGITNAEEIFTTGSGISTYSMDAETTTWYRANISGNVQDTVDALNAMDGIVAAEPNYLYEADSYKEPTEAERNNSWYMQDESSVKGMNLMAGWKTAMEHTDDTPGYGTVVAVIDTGVDYTHEDLTSSMWVNEAELYGTPGVDDDGNGYIDDIYGINTTVDISKPMDPMDDNGHGTHVAGIIAMADNGLGGVGIAYGAKIMAIKAGQSTGSFSSADIAEAITYAYVMGADVINMSFGGTGRSSLIEDALETAFTDCVLVAAAGNDGLPTTDAPDDFIQKEDIYPAAYSYVLGVMASDENGQLASFSNWDYYANKNAEYEMIAPGTNIYSTLPGNRYATWNGTSMAAPCVSAAAAILRSHYDDKDEYSSRFIMGQLASATTAMVNYTDAIGNSHVYPKLDLNASLTRLPKPNLSFSQVFALDNTENSDKNDGDRTMDAGETIDLGVAVRNQWGKATNVTVKADALSDAGVPNPYVTFQTDTVSLDVIGTYAEVDNGFTYDDGELVSVSNPIRFTLSPDTPNDAEICIHLTVTAKNGWGGADATTYTAVTEFTFRVQNGRGIHGHITKDTTLTADTYWIIENSLVIDEGATLTVEPGTQIQFWSSDYEDAYGGKTMAYLHNSGTLNMIGTEEKPIEMFPGAGFENYAVEIAGSGTETLEYCRIVNARLGYEENPLFSTSNSKYIDSCSHCEFWQNTTNPLYRYLSSGVINSNTIMHQGFFVKTLEDSILHDFAGKMGSLSNYGGRKLNIIAGCGNLFDNCLVTNVYTQTYSLNQKNSVFLGGTSSLNPEEGSLFKPLSSITTTVPTFSAPMTYENGSSKYVIADVYDFEFVRELMRDLAAELDGGLLILNDAEEETAIAQWLHETAEATRETGTTSGIGIYACLDYAYDTEKDAWVWCDGSDYVPTACFDTYSSVPKSGYGLYWLTSYPSRFSTDLKSTSGIISSAFRYVLEFPADVTDEAINSLFANFDYTSWKIENLVPAVTNSAILNPVLDTDTSHWTRFIAPDYDSTTYYSLAYNYWGTENKNLINKMIQDDDDFSGTLADIREDPILTLNDDLSAIYPFVTKIWLTEHDSNTVVETASPGYTYDVHVTYNRDMDQTVQPSITYGSASPYTDYRVYGSWKNAREWVGTTKISAITTGGKEIFRAKGGCAADDGWLVCGTDTLRFQFTIDSVAAQSVVLNATGETGQVKLTWAQNDYDVLAGYNLYRSTTASGKYTKLNTAILTGNTYTDTEVQDGVTYYYYFTVVNTDGNEIDGSQSNVASAAPLDVTKPVITHTPVTSARVGSSVSVSATVTDNIAVSKVTLYYRAKGDSAYESANMTYNDTTKKYTATIGKTSVTAAGLEYYIDAVDSTGNHAFSGSAAAPYVISTDATPTLLTASPSTVNVGGTSTTITVYGTNLTEGMTVKLGTETISDYTAAANGESITFTAPELPIGTYSIAVTANGTTITLANAVTYRETGSFVQINAATVLSGQTLRLPVYVGTSSSLTAFHGEVEIPSSSFSSVKVELPEDVKATLVQNYSGGKLSFSLAGSADFNPGSQKPLVYLVLTPRTVQTETSVQLTLTSGTLNGAETVTSKQQTSVTIYPNFTLHSTVKYFQNSIAVPDVTITASNVSGKTGADGTVTLTGINRADVTVTAQKLDKDATNAITANDALLALRNSVGLVTLTDSQKIAGDVNGDGKVNEVDASLILQWSVQLIDSFTAGSWAFVPSYQNKNLTSDTTNVNFTAILIGDLDGSWKGTTK